jgi:hypothetical protein
MQELQWTFRDRTGWGSGPWDDEPDKMQWTDAATGLPCMIHRNQFGAWCGYVGVGPTHPAHGKTGDDLDLSAHGSVNFADRCDPHFNPETGQGVCHLPEPGEPDDVWWLGFDCAHAWDFVPGMAALMRPDPFDVAIGDPSSVRRDNLQRVYRSMMSNDVYRDIAYVRAECALLAAQLQSHA